MRRFQGLADALVKSLKLTNAVFDGEILVMGESAPDFRALMQARGRPEYAAFDGEEWDDGPVRPMAESILFIEQCLLKRPGHEEKSNADPIPSDASPAH